MPTLRVCLSPSIRVTPAFTIFTLSHLSHFHILPAGLFVASIQVILAFFSFSHQPHFHIRHIHHINHIRHINHIHHIYHIHHISTLSPFFLKSFINVPINPLKRCASLNRNSSSIGTTYKGIAVSSWSNFTNLTASFSVVRIILLLALIVLNRF